MSTDRGPFAGLDDATLQANLTAAQNAYAELMTGVRMVSTEYSQGGDLTMRQSYTQADKASLLAYIQMLQAALGVVEHPRRSIRPMFY